MIQRRLQLTGRERAGYFQVLQWAFWCRVPVDREIPVSVADRLTGREEEQTEILMTDVTKAGVTVGVP